MNERIQKHPDGSIERWRDVIGWTKFYRFSDRGRYKSLPRTVIRRNGSPLTVRGRIMKTNPDRYGYLMTILQEPGRKEMPYVHHIVLEAFVGPCPPKGECRHIDGNKLNNHLSNLCWGTKKENGEDRVKHGTSFASAVLQRKLQPSDIPLIHELYESGLYMHQLAKQFGVAKRQIQEVLHGISYRQYQPLIRAKIRPKHTKTKQPKTT